MKAYWGVKYSSTHSLASAPDGGEWSASRPGRFKPRKRVPGTHCIGGWVGTRAGLDAVVKRKIPSPRREWNPKTPIVQPIAHTELFEFIIKSALCTYIKNTKVFEAFFRFRDCITKYKEEYFLTVQYDCLQ
jgi:hypothetical protein